MTQTPIQDNPTSLDHPRYRAHHCHLGEGYAMLSTQRGYVQFAQGMSTHFVRCATREVVVEGLDLPSDDTNRVS